MTDDRAPLLRVVRGQPTQEELAALVTVVAARLAGSPSEPPPSRSPWADLATAIAPVPHPGPDAWRRSARLPGVRTGAGR